MGKDLITKEQLEKELEEIKEDGTSEIIKGEEK